MTTILCEPSLSESIVGATPDFLEKRKAVVLQHPTANGIDYVEYLEDRTLSPPLFWLEITFLKNAPAGLLGNATAFRVEGGERILGIRVTSVTAGSDTRRLKVFVDQPGDFSTYVVQVEHSDLDRLLTDAKFSFKASCPQDFDCRTLLQCPTPELSEPKLDYLAKDFASFRRLLLDFIPQRAPGWLERNPADFGMALVELLAYEGDLLSYFQDAVGTEAYLDTCRHLVSAKRHARLIDFAVHHGRNAWTYIQVDVESAGLLPRATQLLTQVKAPLRGQVTPPTTMIPQGLLDFESDPALRRTLVFETSALAALHPLKNRLRVHAWSADKGCLARFATSAAVYAVITQNGVEKAVAPPLAVGDYVLFEELRGPLTGLEADADPAHRQVVRLTKVETTIDPLFRDILAAGMPLPVTIANQATLPLVLLSWAATDALAFPLCLEQRLNAGRAEPFSGARGNVVPADHGRTIVRDVGVPMERRNRRRQLELHLPDRGLTFQAKAESPSGVAANPFASDRHELDQEVASAQPAIVLELSFAGPEVELWTPVPDLLDSDPASRHFVVDSGDGFNDGRVTLRFGDGDYGRRPVDVVAVAARYRLGSGTAGNVGRGALAHAVLPTVTPADFPTIKALFQPLPAIGGVAAQSLEEIRRHAPAAFRAEQRRAVTPADYEKAALALDGVGAAKASFRYTGSWLTVFVAVHPKNPADLLTAAGGRTRLRPELEHAVRAQLRRFQIAGYDLELRTARYVPLEIAAEICVAPGHFRGDVLRAAQRALSRDCLPDGRKGFFHPSHFGFGTAVALSRIYAALEAVPGVESAAIKTFKRFWQVAGNELDQGLLPLAEDEIARLDNDANFPERGVLSLTGLGGL
jgi:hypothetical protein